MKSYYNCNLRICLFDLRFVVNLIVEENMNSSNQDSLLDMLEKVYVEEIKIKAQLKILKESIDLLRAHHSSIDIEFKKQEEWNKQVEDKIKGILFIIWIFNIDIDLRTTISIEKANPKSELPKQVIACVIRDHSSLQVATRRLVDLLDEMRENRDAFIHELTLLQHQVQDLKEVFASLMTQNTQSFHQHVNYNSLSYFEE